MWWGHLGDEAKGIGKTVTRERTMFGYELQQARRDELQRRADEWRLAQQAKAARAERRAAARRTTTRSAVRTDGEAAESPPAAGATCCARTARHDRRGGRRPAGCRRTAGHGAPGNRCRFRATA
jgi:hypothetical protein